MVRMQRGETGVRIALNLGPSWSIVTEDVNSTQCPSQADHDNKDFSAIIIVEIGGENINPGG